MNLSTESIVTQALERVIIDCITDIMDLCTLCLVSKQIQQLALAVTKLTSRIGWMSCFVLHRYKNVREACILIRCKKPKRVTRILGENVPIIPVRSYDRLTISIRHMLPSGSVIGWGGGWYKCSDFHHNVPLPRSFIDPGERIRWGNPHVAAKRTPSESGNKSRGLPRFTDDGWGRPDTTGGYKGLLLSLEDIPDNLFHNMCYCLSESSGGMSITVVSHIYKMQIVRVEGNRALFGTAAAYDEKGVSLRNVLGSLRDHHSLPVLDSWQIAALDKAFMEGVKNNNKK